jgi:quercetin dioxygenase-like cupin family protein
MNSKSAEHNQEHLDLVFLYTLHALPAGERPDVEALISACSSCRRELETLRPVVDSFVYWENNVLRPSRSLWGRLAQRIAQESGPPRVVAPSVLPPKSEWEQAAPGIHVKILATDSEQNRVSMLVRLEPGTEYPPHRHDGVEELHLLHGVLMIDEKKLHPGDYIRAEADSVDHRVWSETGCTCVLLTSTRDELLSQ